jgi:DNA-binding GntR family transcriptional regulator
VTHHYMKVGAMESTARSPNSFAGMTSGPSFREQARLFIRGLIVTGQMKRDEIYSIPRLAGELQVSATPVREALLDLASEGLLEPVRNRGFRVVALSPKELSDIFAIRLLLEVPTVAEVASRGATAEQLQRLRGLATSIRESAESDDLIGFLEEDRKFHIALIDLAGNEPLSKMVAALRDRVRLFGVNAVKSKEHLATSANEHFRLLDLIEKRDADGAAAMIRRHLERSRDLWAASQAATAARESELEAAARAAG